MRLVGIAESRQSGDFDVSRQCRRLRLALDPDGWRGNVEAAITSEMRGLEGDSETYAHQLSAAKSRVDWGLIKSGGLPKDTDSEKRDIDLGNIKWQEGVSSFDFADDDVSLLSDVADSKW